MLEYLIEQKRRCKPRTKKVDFYEFYKNQIDMVREIKRSRKKKDEAH